MKERTGGGGVSGVSAGGMIRDVMASILAAFCGVKKSNFGRVAGPAALCACVAAVSRADQFAVTHAALRPVPARSRKWRRLSSFIVKFPGLPDCRMKPILRQGHLTDAQNSNSPSKLARSNDRWQPDPVVVGCAAFGISADFANPR